MENLGKTFLIVIDPSDFDMKQQKVFHSDFGFVIVTPSEFFRDSMIRLCKECHSVRKRNFGPKIITSARKRMREFVNRSIKIEYEFLELVALLFDIAYYTAVSHDKVAHLRKFIAIEGISPKFFGYIGSKDYKSSVIINKIQNRIENAKGDKKVGSCFEIYQVTN